MYLPHWAVIVWFALSCIGVVIWLNNLSNGGVRRDENYCMLAAIESLAFAIWLGFHL